MHLINGGSSVLPFNFFSSLKDLFLGIISILISHLFQVLTGMEHS